MYLEVIDRLKSAHDALCDWLQPFVLPDGTDLSQAVGPNAIPPTVPYQPRCFPVDRHFKPLSHFMFDPELFYGPEAIRSIYALIKQSCPGFTWVKQNKAVDLVDRLLYRLRCSHYKINHGLEQSEFVPGKCTRPNVVPAREKKYQAKSNHSYSKMGFTGLKPSARSRKRQRQSIKSQLKDSKPAYNKRRTNTKMADTADHRCHVNIVVFMCKSTRHWYLCPSSYLLHSFHPSEESSSLLTEDDLLDDQKKFLNYLLEHGVSPAITSQIMTKLVNETGRPGEFTPKTIHNIGEKTTRLMDQLDGIGENWTVAQKTLGVLERCVYYFISSSPISLYFRGRP